jgi:branched-chain amino acid transport system permease protein
VVQLLQLIISGAAIGCIYALIALGFVLIYKATETVNFAQGDIMMVGGFVGLSAMTLGGLPFWAAFLVTIVVMTLFGMGAERLVLRPLLGQPAFTVIMMTIGLGYLARGVVTMIPYWGTETHSLPVPMWRSSSPPWLWSSCCSPFSVSRGWASPCRRHRRTSSRPFTWAFRCGA